MKRLVIVCSILILFAGCGRENISQNKNQDQARTFDIQKITQEVKIQAPDNFVGGVNLGKGGLYSFEANDQGTGQVDHMVSMRPSEESIGEKTTNINGRNWISSEKTLYQGACFTDSYYTPYEDYFLEVSFASCHPVDKTYDGAERFKNIIQPTLESFTLTDSQESMRHLPPHTDLAAEFTQAVFKTNKGDITVEFFADKSPVTVNNFMNLAQEGFYNGTTFHRVIEGFMIQGGDPNSQDQENRQIHGTGGPDYRFGDEFNDEKLVRGSLAMANAGPNTNGSQFFIVTAPETPHLDGRHTNFGTVVSGMNVVDAIEGVSVDMRDNPIEPVVIESIELK